MRVIFTSVRLLNGFEVVKQRYTTFIIIDTQETLLSVEVRQLDLI